MQILNTDQIGYAARRFLHPEVGGEVLAAVSKAIYLETTAGEILWIHGRDSPCHACGLLVERIPSIKPGALFRLQGSTLLLGGSVRIEMERASTWLPPRPNLNALLPLRHLPDRWIEFVLSFVPQTKPGLETLMSMIQHRAFPTRFPIPAVKPNPIQYGAWIQYESMINYCFNQDADGVFALAEALIGLGNGLTPAGDDYLGGVFFASHQMGELYRTLKLFNAEELRTWLERVRLRTHSISYAMLSDHAHGSGAETLHHFMNSFLSEEPVTNVVRTARQLERLGGSSGGDLMAGVLSGILLAFSPSFDLQRASLEWVAPVMNGR
jgi:hypothetical protein